MAVVAFALLATDWIAAQVSSSGGGRADDQSEDFYRQWTMEDLWPAVTDLDRGRSYEQGERVFESASCGLCHSFATRWAGNGLAPDLTGVRSALSRQFILESIIEPSATINGRFYHTRFRLKDGRVIDGSLLDIVNGTFLVAQVMMAPDVTIEISEGDVIAEVPSPVSPMPAGLVDRFTSEEILDLMAFLESGGNPSAAVYSEGADR